LLPISTGEILREDLFSDPVIIHSIELLRYEDNFLCRVRSKDGAEGISVSNNMQMVSLYPIFTRRIQPFFIGKDARKLETLLEEIYVYQSNYKLQNLAFWVPLATLEFAILDMLGKIASLPLANLLGETYHKSIAVYQANNYRGKSAEESIELIKKDVYGSNAKALKFKIGGRMSNNKDYPPGRTEQLIPLVRKAFGDDMTIYADSNGSYDINEAVRIGKILETYKIDFFEEPVPFDWYDETKKVADQLTIPIAGGEQEPSLHQFKWLIENDGLDIVQPDIFYFGGMIRSLKVARMAHEKNKLCVPHISGSGLGYLYMMHFVSILPNAGPYHEFKGFNQEIPFECSTSKLESKDGTIEVPTGPGLGIELDPEFIAKHHLVE
ncbi:MAG: mandelate racemase/muconate lactonizing enzyme family protein, partial [Saprospiraceae bacterium]|nr:mandelate racemase/muconate lactonizing enzyme family protein [Saprospiraceae bacterium]